MTKVRQPLDEGFSVLGWEKINLYIHYLLTEMQHFLQLCM